MLRRCSFILVLFLSSSIPTLAQEASRVGWDFERQALSTEWTAGGKITAARAIGELAEKPKPIRAGDLVPSGQIATIDAEAGSSFALRKELPRVPWELAERISFWVSRSAEEARRDPDCTFDLLFIDPASRVVFSRRIVLKGSGWQQIEIPTRWIAPVTGRVGTWSGVQWFGFSFREESHLALDAVQADFAARPRAAMSLDEMLPIAFPGVAPAAIKTAEREAFVIATNSTECEPTKLVDVLQPVVVQVAMDLPLMDVPVPARLLIFATRDEYQKFPPRLAEKYGKEAAQPQSDGFTLLGWATSNWDAKQGIQRPVFVHEFIHSLLEARLGIANQGEWLQEGLATYYQLHTFPQKNFATLVHANLATEQFDLNALTSGKPIATTAYWQAATLCSLLLRDPAYQPKLKALIAAIQKQESTALEPHLATVLKTNFTLLTNDWQKHCREAWPVKP